MVRGFSESRLVVFGGANKGDAPSWRRFFGDARESPEAKHVPVDVFPSPGVGKLL